MSQFDNTDLKAMGGITTIITIILAAFKLKFNPQIPLPPALITYGSKLRQGMSSQQIASRIISRQQEAGAPVGDLPDGSDNVSERMEKIRVEEIINAIMTESKIDVVLPPGTRIQGVGISPFIGPFSVNGATISSGIGSGIMS